MHSVSQHQLTGAVVEIPGFVADFVDTAPWRPIRSLKARLEGRDPCAPADPPCEHQRELFGEDPIADPHWYVMRHYVDGSEFRKVASAVRKLGYRAEYIRPYNPRPLRNNYLELGEYVYWWIYPNQLCRTKIAWRQHRPLPI